MTTSRRILVPLLLAGLILSGCSGDDDPEPVDDATAAEPADDQDLDDAGPVTDEDLATDDEAIAADDVAAEEPADDLDGAAAEDEEVDLATWESRRPECEDGPDRTVTHLDPVVIPAVEIPAVEVPDQTVGDEVVEGIAVPAQRIPQQVVDTGCIVEYDAPAGCLGRVEISGFEIPSVEIPAVELPGVSLGDRAIDPREIDGRVVDGRSSDGRVVEERCQREPSSGAGVVAAVVRPATVRPAAVRPALVRPAAARQAICTDDGCVDALTIDAVAVDAVAVDAVAIDAAILDAYLLEGTDAEYVEEQDRTAYLAPADVLFGFDEAELTDEATPTLERIAEELVALGDAEVAIEGHTDGVGDDAYNQQLSEDRAQAVADWLVEQGDIAADRISVTGYGASNPVAEETTATGEDDPDGRALNRRVVISVATG